VVIAGRSTRTISRRFRSGGASGFALALALLPGPAHALGPMSYLQAFGERAGSILDLTWTVLIIALLVVAIITVLLIGGLMRGWRGRTPVTAERTAIVRRSGAVAWLYYGVGISTLVLFGTTVWTLVTLANVSRPSRKPAVTIQVTGHQWWWEVRYLSDDPSRVFETANEIHIPVGEPVQVKLVGSDVIHSFWVPALNGKTDTIPGKTNLTWLEADKPGVYRGQCTEYCGLQHAHMAFQVIASPPDEFKAWWNKQLEGVPTPTTDAAIEEQNDFIKSCGICHAVRGTRAGGRMGPNLSHLMARKTIAAGTLPNTPGYLSAWIADPQHIKPGAEMPRLDLSGPELKHIRDFLETLN
jgi:cytochrome c oxidase subunit 2